ncbi:MAG TPA: TIGR03013 family XrtA/PEP-CTERM system glycosyltransferase [Aromatoleum sp.]|uniref:TIGR03013 family XrtA/PEP-CTERM system glycosyltransferase n=1 Tax=Aromatoleum sp. TaxID=2307007 RepID=UPI002B49E445|nr:TIGR03013 family XrtA/PEP-CTERM system glycosyltransferase [Aromatoleum sp.]HJV26846.1 TIGR03013 family XrtA/PEP-CTERM system glycosyltransferase [Aromatoleum sp.]
MLKVFGQYFPSGALHQVAFDALILFVAVVFAVLVETHGADADWRMVAPSAITFTIFMIFLNSALGFYRVTPVGLSGRAVVARLAVSLLVSIPLAWGVFSILPWDYFASEALQFSVVLLVVVVLLMRGVVSRHESRSVFAPRVLVIGTGPEAVEVQRSLGSSGRSGMEIVGFYAPGGEDCRVVSAGRVIENGMGLLEAVRDARVNDIIVAVRERRGGVLPIRELLDCKLRGVRVMDLSSFFERVQGKVRIDSLKASWLIYGDGFRQSPMRTFTKRCFDLAAAFLLLLPALPIMAVTSILILLEDGGPVFYRQERVGRAGRIFRVVKFRSMRRDAESDGKPRWATSHDDRVTRVGRILRRLRIDELPQLFNVISGEMSLVGPRPERPYFVDQLSHQVPFYAVRHSVKPGVTGWAQVRYQYGASIDEAIEKLQYDLYYVKNHTLVLDTLVLFETVRVVLTGEGAH